MLSRGERAPAVSIHEVREWGSPWATEEAGLQREVETGREGTGSTRAKRVSFRLIAVVLH